MWKSALSHTLLSAFLLTPLALALGGPGCGQAVTVCDLVCECTHCSDRAEDACIINVDRMIETAAAYDCTEDFDKYVECIEKDGDCNDTNFTADDCLADELVDLLECMNDESDIMASTGAIIGEGEGETAPPPPGQ